MRGTTDRKIFEAFVTAIKGFPPARHEGEPATKTFNDSYAVLDRLASGKPDFPRAKAWKAYALAISVSEGWQFDPERFAREAAMPGEERLQLAAELAGEAVKLDETDYDVWWALGNIELIRHNADAAREAYRKALYLNQDEVNPNLLAEAADAAIHLGDYGSADRLSRLAFTRPDWHHWIMSWKYFMLTRTIPQNEPIFLDLALAELDNTKRRPGQNGYLPDMLLLRAAIHARKWKFLDKMPAETDVGVMTSATAASGAEKERQRAHRAFAAFQKEFPNWDIAQARRFAPFIAAEDSAYWHESLQWVWQA